ncbi:MAG: TolC family protein [Cyclobacteriaceae bacterium]
MNKAFLLIFIPAFLIIEFPAFSQDALSQGYSLFEIVDLALGRSPAALQAETRRENRYWQWRAFRSNYMPRVNLSGELPNFTRANEPITQEDGTVEFRPVSQNFSELNLFATQAIGYSGTEIFLNSNIERFDDFERNTTRFSGEPASIGLRQPLFQYNYLKWAREIEPLQYEESKKEYSEDVEQIAIDATEQYFQVLIAQINLAIASKNRANNDTIYQIAQGRYNLGTIPENELLQLELNLMRSRQDVAQAQLDLETSTLQLKSFIGLTESAAITLEVPDDIPSFSVNEEVAIREAFQNRSDAVAFERRLRQAESEIALARGDNGISIDIYASYGLTNRSDRFFELYDNPENQSRVRVGFDIPILDWGRSKSRVKQAEANYKLEQYTIEQERVNFEQRVYTQVRTFDMLRNQIEIAQAADDIANRSYEISKQRFLIGKITIVELNNALENKDSARQQYVQSLNDFWTAYYTLRLLTLYDFEQGAPLYVPQGD